MRIDAVSVIRAPLRRTDPGRKTSLDADAGMAGFVLEVRAEGATGLGATSGMPLQLADDALQVQLRDVVAPALQGRDPRRRTAILGGSAAPAAVDVAGAHRVLASGAFNTIAEVGQFEAVAGDPLRGARIEADRLRVTDEPGFGLTLAEA